MIGLNMMEFSTLSFEVNWHYKGGANMFSFRANAELAKPLPAAAEVSRGQPCLSLAQCRSYAGLMLALCRRYTGSIPALYRLYTDSIPALYWL